MANMVDELIDERKQRVLSVLDSLTTWCERFQVGQQPWASITMSAYYESISIAEIVVWDSENGYGDEITKTEPSPTFAGCVQSYKNQMDCLTRWPRTSKRGD